MKHFKTISELHQFRQLPKPEHPLMSIINVEDVKHISSEEPMSLSFDFYSIAIKRVSNYKVKYGQQEYDFDEGILTFMSPNQVFSIIPHNKNEEIKQSGWVIYIHPDFLWNTPLAKTINNMISGIIQQMKPCFFQIKKNKQSSTLFKTSGRNIMAILINTANRL